MTALNPITALRLKRAKSRRAPVPVSQKPRQRRADSIGGPNPYTAAGTLLYSFYEAAFLRKLGTVTVEESQRRARTSKPRTRRGKDLRGRVVSICPCDPAGGRAAERRRRQGAHLHQHPSVVARFANHPSRTEVDAEIARVEGGRSGGLRKAVKRLVGAA